MGRSRVRAEDPLLHTATAPKSLRKPTRPARGAHPRWLQLHAHPVSSSLPLSTPSAQLSRLWHWLLPLPRSFCPQMSFKSSLRSHHLLMKPAPTTLSGTAAPPQLSAPLAFLCFPASLFPSNITEFTGRLCRWDVRSVQAAGFVCFSHCAKRTVTTQERLN